MFLPACRGRSGSAQSAPPGLGGQAGAVERPPAPVDQAGAAESVEKQVVERPPNFGSLPVPEPPPAGHAGAAAHLLRQHLPRDAALEDEEDAGQRCAVLDRRAAALRARRTGREQGAEEGPEGVGNERCCHAPTGGKPTAALLPIEGSVEAVLERVGAGRDRFYREVRIPTFLRDCTSEAPLARTYRHLDLDQRRTLFRLVEGAHPVGEIARRLAHPSTIYRGELGRNRFRDRDRGFCGYP